MELLVWVLNHDGPQDRPQDRPDGAAAGRLCGIAVGSSPEPQSLTPRRPVTSFAEFRADLDVEDPLTELQLAVPRVLAQVRAFAPDQVLEYAARGCVLRMRLEPGFDDARTVIEPLAQLLRSFTVKGGVVVSNDLRASLPVGRRAS
jgi:hypothetical protein